MAKTKLIPIKDFGSIYDRSSFIHFPAFYAQLTGTVASVINVFNIDQKPLKNCLLIKYEIGEHNIIESREYIPSLQEMRNVISIVKIKPDLFVQFSFHQNSVDIFFNHDVSKEDVDDLLNFILIYTKKPKEITTIGLIIDSSDGLTVRKFEVSHMELDNGNYNDDFPEFDKYVLSRLTDKAKGIILLHGSPGTGKTSYIRSLLSRVNKRFIYLPPDMSNYLSEPSFINFLSRQANTVLVIEDAEQVLQERKSSGRSAISNLLNLSDGLLSDCLKIQIICTFNAELTKIDKALLRKGRIIAKYEFLPLSENKSNTLLESLHTGMRTEKPMTLAEIFNHDEKEFTGETKGEKLGFSWAV
ncbi:MAG: AAA family ATPase [Bacteroidetes bacterium]|nr:AAA family ATPase [Bacteroidota bacterium]